MILQRIIFAWACPRLFSTTHTASATGAVKFFGLLAFSFLVLPEAAWFNMTSVAQFMKMETAFTILHSPSRCH
jgi:hypothetical protein